jgi:hypothetical protein
MDAFAVTDPLPLPEDPATIVTQVAPLDAVHVQPVWVVTDIRTVPPDLPIDVAVGVTVYEHFFCAFFPAPVEVVLSSEVRLCVLVAACVIVNVSPATVSVPVRGEELVFACTV